MKANSPNWNGKGSDKRMERKTTKYGRISKMCTKGIDKNPRVRDPMYFVVLCLSLCIRTGWVECIMVNDTSYF